MPRRIDSINDVHEAIVRPVAFQVVRSLAKSLNLPEDVGVLFPGMWGEAPNTGSTLDGTAIQDPSAFKNKSRFAIEVVERAAENRVMATAVHRRDNHAIFLDKALGVAIYPVVVATEMTLNVSFRAQGRVEADRFRNDILTRFAEGRTDFMHEIDYHYVIPHEQLLLLEHIHSLRETVAPYEEDLSTWVNNHISDRATNVATLIATEKKVAIREKQVSPNGYFGFVGEPEAATKDREGAPLNITFTYTFTYDQVVSCVMQYPLMVHSQFLDVKWYSRPNASGTMVNQMRRNRAPSMTQGYFDVISHMTPDWEKLQYELVRSPYFDDWSPDYRLPFTTEVIQAPAAIDPENPRELFNLDDIEEFSFEAIIREFLISESAFACDFKTSIFHCALYEDMMPMSDTSLRLLPDLTFVATKDLDPRKRYHIQVSLVHALASLTPSARERLRNSGQAGISILEWLQLKLIGWAYIPGLIGTKLIKNDDLRKIEEILDRRPGRDRDHYFRLGVMKTVGQFGIIAKRRIPDGAA